MGSPRLPLSLALLAVVLTATAAEARPIQRISRSLTSGLCQRVDYPKLCDSLTETLHTVSPLSLTKAAIKAAAAKAAAAKGVTASLMASPGTEKLAASCLDVCRQSFGDTLDDLQAGLKFLTTGGSHADVMTHLSAAVSDTETCNDAFSEEPGMSNPVAHVNSNLQKLVKNSLALADSLK